MNSTSNFFFFLFLALVSCDVENKSKESDNPHQLDREIKVDPKHPKNARSFNPINIEGGRWSSVKDLRTFAIWASPEELTQLRFIEEEDYGIRRGGRIRFSELRAADGRVLFSDVRGMDVEMFRKRFQDAAYLAVMLSVRQIKDANFLEALSDIEHLGIVVHERDPDQYLSRLATIPSLEMLVVEGALDLKNVKILSKMHQLRSLDLIASNIRDSDLELLSELSNLRNLGLHYTKLTHLEALTKLPRLASYSFTDKLVNINALKNIPTLKTLGGRVTKAQLEVISRMEQLQRLELESESRITNKDLERLSDLRELQYLDLSGAHLTDLEALKSFKNLRTLLLDDAPKISDIIPLRNLKNLEYLSLKGLRHLQDFDILRETPNLRYLSLSSISPQNYDALAELKKLQYLNLRSSDIHDLSPLKGNIELRTLDLKYTEFIRKDSLEVLQHLKNLDIRD